MNEESGLPVVVFTDRQPVLAARELIDMPVALVASSDRLENADPDTGEIRRTDAAHAPAPVGGEIEFEREGQLRGREMYGAREP